jgi:lipoate-protein ligase A
MPLPFRVVDSGVRSGRLQIATDEALIELHRAGRVPDTVRFLRFHPSALVGRHQAVGREIRLDYARAHDIGIVRRVTGGGAIYLDPGQVGWELVLSRKRLPMATLADYASAICEAVALGLARTFGIAARFRPRSDIEVDGRKLCGTGGFFDGDTLIYQGTVLVDADLARVMACLNLPVPSSGPSPPRMTTLKELLGAAPPIEKVHEALLSGLAERLGIAPGPVESMSAEEEILAARLYAEEIGTDAFVYSIDTGALTGPDMVEASRGGPGGTITAALRLEGDGGARRIREALITGDFFIAPPRAILDLEAALRGVEVAAAGAAVARVLEERPPSMMTVSAADIRATIEEALAKAAPPARP